MVINGFEVGEVKPCPICGGLNFDLTERESYNELCEKHGRSMVSLECNDCDLELKQFAIPGNNYDLGIGILITRWNARREAQNGTKKD